MHRIKKYYRLTKPGIIRGNLMVATAAFLFASDGEIDILILIGVLVGVSLVIASGCVLNNYIDIDIDSKMERTNKRALVTGEISKRNAMIYAGIMGIGGLYVLYVMTNPLTAVLGILGLFFYVVVYGYFKGNSVFGTLVGSVSGAIPPVAGYTAVTNSLDLAALLLFLTLAIWQMPHFYAIAIYRRKDYKKAGIPVLSIVRGVDSTRVQIIVYIIAFAVISLAIYFYGFTGIIYAVAMFIVSLWWLKTALSKHYYKDSNRWAHSVFGVSLIVLLVFSLMLSLNSFLT